MALPSRRQGQPRYSVIRPRMVKSRRPLRSADPATARAAIPLRYRATDVDPSSSQGHRAAAPSISPRVRTRTAGAAGYVRFAAPARLPSALAGAALHRHGVLDGSSNPRVADVRSHRLGTAARAGDGGAGGAPLGPLA